MAKINRAEISKINVSLLKMEHRFTTRLTSALAALVLSFSVNAQKMPAEIEYFADDNVTNQIPYFNNRFRIDEQLDEVTLLFYRRSGTQPVILVRPDGSKLNVNSAPKDEVQWFDDRTFDMIKIKSPMIGPWQVIGQVQPKSKIMVISEILLDVTPLPDIVLQGETLKMEGRLFNGEMAIDNPAFNDVLMLDVDFFSTNNSNFDNFGAEPIKLTSFRDDGRGLDEHAKDSLFTGEFTLDFAPGEWEPIYIVKMPMATRKLRQTPIIVQKNPITISVATTQDKNDIHLATFSIDDSFVNANSILIQGNITFPDRQVEPFSIMKGKGITRTYSIGYTEPGIHRIKIGVFGETTNGREFRATVPEFSFNVDRVGGLLVPTLNGETPVLTSKDKNTQAIANAELEAEKLAQALIQAKISQEKEIADKQLTTILYIVAGNTLILIIAILIFILVRRKKQK
jgi:uncharacterized protein (TIGR03503 family)